MTDFPLGQKIGLAGHFNEPMLLEAVRPLGRGYECRVRLSIERLEETIIPQEESEALLGNSKQALPGSNILVEISITPHL